MDIPLFTEYGLNYLFRWGHMLFGVVWIGLLYYFNFVQTEYFKEAEADHRSGAIQKLVPRALWWFRWGAALTFITGLYLLWRLHGAMTYDITVGATLGTLMAINVWFIIWPNQKIVIASATQVAGGGEALPEAVNASRHQVIHQVIAAGDRVKYAADHAGFCRGVYPGKAEVGGVVIAIGVMCRVVTHLPVLIVAPVLCQRVGKCT